MVSYGETAHLEVIHRRLDVEHVDPMLRLLADISRLLGLLLPVRLEELPLVRVGEHEDADARLLLVALGAYASMARR